jgi:cell division protein FtsB
MRRLLLPALLLIALYYAFFGGEYGVADVKRIRMEQARLMEEVATLRLENRRLEDRIDALENDPRALETLARERFGLIRNGEVLYRFAEPERPAPRGAQPGGGNEVDSTRAPR